MDKKTVFFDLGNVLLFFSHDKMFKQVAHLFQKEETVIRSFFLSQDLTNLYEKGMVSSRKFYAECCRLLKLKAKVGFSDFLNAISDIFQPNEALIPILFSLKKNDVRLILLSNTCEAHFDFAYRHFPQLHLFDAYVLSYKVGAKKPENKIFEHALSLAQCPIENCFYTDDIEEFVQAARKMNIESHLYTSQEELQKQLVQKKFLPFSI